MKRLSFQMLFVILLGGNIISSCGSSGYKPSDYISTTGIAESGQETKVELEDGAAMIIPHNSIDNQVAVKIERNPEKAQTLPPIGEGFVQVSDFYNFEVTSGNLTGPVDLTFPINSDLIPDEAGVLVMAIPTENGWEFVPVESKDGKVAVFTDQIGDPLIAWHFVEHIPLCDPDIAVHAIQNGDKVEIVGKLLPVRKSLFAASQEEPASGIPVTIELNRQYGESGWLESYILSATTQNDGSFSVTLDSSQGLKEGWNWIFVNAQCNKPWWGEYIVSSKGYAEFKYTPPVVEQASNPQPTEPPIVEQPIEAPIPAGAVLLPDFVGQSIDDAINWLKANGFKYTWIDGSSTYDLGMVYNQAPAGNQYKVPHRTVIVLYRTVTKSEPIIEDFFVKYECVDAFWIKYRNSLDNGQNVPWYETGREAGCGEYDKPRDYNFTSNFLPPHLFYSGGSSSQSFGTITMQGMSIDVIIVDSEYETEKSTNPWTDYGVVRLKSYYDKTTGFLLRTESQYTVIGCPPVPPNSFEACANTKGVMTSSHVYELSDTNFIYGNK